MSTSSTPSPETLSGPETVAIARTPSGRDRDSGPAGLPVARSPPAAGTSAALLGCCQLRCVYFISRQTDFQQISVTTVIASRGQASRQPSDPAGQRAPAWSQLLARLSRAPRGVWSLAAPD